MTGKIGPYSTAKKFLLLCIFLSLITMVWFTSPSLTRFGRILYFKWVEYQKINDLTKQHGDELFEVVKGFENRHSLTGYANRDEYCQYLMSVHLEVCHDIWDRLNKGEIQQLTVITEFKHPRVFFYSEDVSGIMVTVRQVDVRYDVNNVEIMEASKQNAMISYNLGFENGKWKVRIKDICVEGEERCTLSLGNLGYNWYSSIFD